MFIISQWGNCSVPAAYKITTELQIEKKNIMLNLNRREYKYLQCCVDGVSLCYAHKPNYWFFCLALCIL